jgi:uncharacterized protein YifE (UPF0438 family)
MLDAPIPEKEIKGKKIELNIDPGTFSDNEIVTLMICIKTEEAVNNGGSWWTKLKNAVKRRKRLLAIAGAIILSAVGAIIGVKAAKR